MKKIILVFLFISFFCTSCTFFKSTPHEDLISKLNKKGIVLLSPDNPYIATNLLVATEINNSQELEGFISHKGLPNLIQVRDELFFNLQYDFYYPKDRAYYTLEKVNEGWIINGPKLITDMQNQEIYYITGGHLYDPQILSKDKLPAIYKKKKSDDKLEYDETSNEDAEGISTESHSENLKEFSFNDNENETPLKNTTPHGRIKKDITKMQSPKASTDNKKNNKATITKQKTQTNAASSKRKTAGTTSQDPMLDMIIDANSTYTSELNFRGDLIHYVTYKGEDLSLISRWYTKDAKNKDAIARINSIKKGDAVEVGDKIVIPAYLVKNKNKLTQGALRELTNQYKATDTWNNPPDALPQKPNNTYDKDLEFF